MHGIVLDKQKVAHVDIAADTSSHVQVILD